MADSTPHPVRLREGGGQNESPRHTNQPTNQPLAQSSSKVGGIFISTSRKVSKQRFQVPKQFPISCTFCIAQGEDPSHNAITGVYFS